jgi:(p)ppGpp synthase/HD superfamily hydrolase
MELEHPINLDSNNRLNSYRLIAKKLHDDRNCKYDTYSYIVHLDDVYTNVNKYSAIFKSDNDKYITKIAAFFHDCIEDANITYKDIYDITKSVEVSDIVLCVTDIPAENRLMRHLLTIPKIVKDHRAIILKLCDILANGKYSKSHCSSMFKKYQEEYRYEKPIYQIALNQPNHNPLINFNELDYLWADLDSIFI